MDDSLDELIAAAELGNEAKKFLESDLGKCLIGMAQQEVLAAQEALETITPTDTEKIRELQNHAKVGRYFGQWLRELVDKGETALHVYQQKRQE